MPARDEIGTTAAGPAVAPVQVVFVRLPADAPRQPGEPEKKTSRRSPAKRRRGKQEKKKMIKTIKMALVIALCVGLYLALGAYLPFLGHVAVTFPLLASVPLVGAYVCFLTFKGILSLSAYSLLARKV